MNFCGAKIAGFPKLNVTGESQISAGIYSQVNFITHIATVWIGEKRIFAIW